MISKKLFDYCFKHFECVSGFNHSQCEAMAQFFRCNVADVYDAINTIWYTKFNMKYYQ